jgi:hypothetical protein
MNTQCESTLQQNIQETIIPKKNIEDKEIEVQFNTERNQKNTTINVIFNLIKMRQKKIGTNQENINRIDIAMNMSIEEKKVGSNIMNIEIRKEDIKTIVMFAKEMIQTTKIKEIIRIVGNIENTVISHMTITIKKNREDKTIKPIESIRIKNSTVLDKKKMNIGIVNLTRK